MKNIKNFDKFSINEGKEYKLPAATSDSEKDEETFWFSTENEEKSLILNFFLETVKNSVEGGKKLKDQEVNAQDFWCSYKPGDKVIKYVYEFWTPDDSLVKRSKGHFDGHEWKLEAKVPYDIIEKLNLESISLEDAKSRVKQESTWSLLDGMSQSALVASDGSGWQLAFLMSSVQNDIYSKNQSKKDSWKPQWLKNFSSWFTDKFA
jgi:hypothetical protein